MENHSVTQGEGLFLVQRDRNLKSVQTGNILSLRFNMNSLAKVECRLTFSFKPCWSKL